MLRFGVGMVDRHKDGRHFGPNLVQHRLHAQVILHTPYESRWQVHLNLARIAPMAISIALIGLMPKC